MRTTALALPTVVLLGHWQLLGSQGIFAAAGALFVLTNGSVSGPTATARITEAGFGAVVGIAVNALIRPPVHLRDTRAAVREAVQEAHDVLQTVADGLAEGRWDADEAGTWHERALRLQRVADQARAAIGRSGESLSINLRGAYGTGRVRVGVAGTPGRHQAAPQQARRQRSGCGSSAFALHVRVGPTA
ncbi:hypothetical protein ACWEO4_35145 [Streptomyces sp. NPDC004393]